MSNEQQHEVESVAATGTQVAAPTSGGSQKPKRVRKPKATAEAAGGAQEASEAKPLKATKRRRKAAQEPVAVVDEEKVDEEENGGKGGVKKRTFTVVRVLKEGSETDFKGGRYLSNSPSSAARKSANIACKSYGGGKQEIDIYMEEITKGRPRKQYAYHAVKTPVEQKDVSFKSEKGEPVNVNFKSLMVLRSLRDKQAEAQQDGGAAAPAEA